MAYCDCGNHVICWAIRKKNGKVIHAKDKPFSFCGNGANRRKKQKSPHRDDS